MGTESVITVKDLYVNFWISGTGINSFKDVVMSIGKQKALEKKQVLKGLNLEIKRGECFALMGKNGSGKSTLLRTLAGIITPESGAIEIKGSVAPLLTIGAGLEYELSGYENIKIVGTLIGLRGAELKAAVQTIKDFSELSDTDLNMQIKRYSAGMMARLAFSISVCRIPDILIVDEALSVGDQGFQVKCADRINEMKAAGTTIIYVSHSLTELKRICTRGACLENGQIAKIGPIDEVGEYYTQSFLH
ncbi:MAG: ABC transporter ATP-binding protein [Bacteroidia bacterium]|jgi:ABC-type polysaccharide/polyol phosphate transport system ATPase subunit|nr:ABC transporter ATP-binding protein [Bacteroidia bacterium]